MKKRARPVGIHLFMVAILFIIVGCPVPPGTYGPLEEFEGTWRMSSGGDTLTLAISRTSLTMTFTGSSNGSLTLAIDYYDIGANHIRAESVSGTGDFAGYTPGIVFYWIYAIPAANTMMVDFDGSTYPAAATVGPFSKL